MEKTQTPCPVSTHLFSAARRFETFFQSIFSLLTAGFKAFLPNHILSDGIIKAPTSFQTIRALCSSGRAQTYNPSTLPLSYFEEFARLRWRKRHRLTCRRIVRRCLNSVSPRIFRFQPISPCCRPDSKLFSEPLPISTGSVLSFRESRSSISLRVFRFHPTLSPLPTGFEASLPNRILPDDITKAPTSFQAIGALRSSGRARTYNPSVNSRMLCH